MPKSDPVGITAVWLRREGGCDNGQDDRAVVLVEINGQWHRLITESLYGGGGPFSHITEARAFLESPVEQF